MPGIVGMRWVHWRSHSRTVRASVSMEAPALSKCSADPLPRQPTDRSSSKLSSSRVRPHQREGSSRWQRATERADFGGKASALARLTSAPLNVPPGFAIDPAFTEAVAAEDEAHLAQLRAALSDLAGPWAVRSSALSEDGVTASFAGQFATVLGVRDARECARAVREVWASAHTPGVAAYRKRLGLVEPPQMAVVVQQIVDAAAAGVLFTGDDGKHIVESCWGLGEPLVAGAITPDRFTIDTGGKLLSKELSDKPTELRLGSAGPPTACAVEPSRKAAPSLTDEQLAALAALAASAQEIFGGPQDIEFVFDREGTLYCVQSRPVTVSLPNVAKRAPAERIRVE